MLTDYSQKIGISQERKKLSQDIAIFLLLCFYYNISLFNNLITYYKLRSLSGCWKRPQYFDCNFDSFELCSHLPSSACASTWIEKPSVESRRRPDFGAG